MNKRTLLLVASTILAAGVVAAPTAEAKVNTNYHTNGAIIQQMSKDITPELADIHEQRDEADNPYEKEFLTIQVYENNKEYKNADASFDELIGMLKEAENEDVVNEYYDKLKTVYNDFHAFAPSNPRYSYKLSILEKNFGSYEDAFEYLKKALTYSPTNPTFRNEYAQYALDNNDYDKAITILKTLRKSDPREVDYRISLAKAYTQAGMYDDAIREYRVASAFEPENNDTIIALNELSNYAGVSGYDPYALKPYNKSTFALSRPVASPDGQRLVAFNAPETKAEPEMRQASNGSKTFAVGTKTAAAKPAKKEVAVVRRVSEVDRSQQYQQVEYTQPVKNQQVRQIKQTKPQPVKRVQPVQQPVQQEVQETPAVDKIQVTQAEEQVDNSKKAKKAKKAKPSGSKRVMVSYVNGRKVVKIVNINTDADTSQSLEDAPQTFRDQLEESNSSNNYSSYQEDNYGQSATAFEQTDDISLRNSNTPKIDTAQGNITQTRKSNYPQNKYSVQEEQNYRNVSSSGDLNPSSLSSNRGGKQMVVTYKNGKRYVQTGDGTSASNTTSTVKKDKKAKKGEKPAVQTSQNNSDLYLQANELMAQRKFADVIQVLKQVQPPTLRSLTAMAACYNELGQPDVAIQYYKEADKSSPENTQILYSIGYLYFTQNDTVSAKKYVDLALKADPENANAKELNKYLTQQESNVAMNQAIAFMNNNNYSEAKKTLEKIVKENPSDFQAYYYLGHIGYATQKYEEATRNFSLAIQYNPEYALSYYSIGLAFDKLREFHHSLPAYEQFLKMETDDNKYTQYAKTRIATIRAKK